MKKTQRISLGITGLLKTTLLTLASYTPPPGPAALTGVPLNKTTLTPDEGTDADTADFGPWSTPTTKTIDIADGAAALDTYLKSIAGTPGNYAVTVTGAGQQIAPSSATNPSFDLACSVTISLRGNGTLVKTGDADMWGIGWGAKLILQGPTLDSSGKNRALVFIRSGGEFVMEDGTITGSDNCGGYGGGVYVTAVFSRMTDDINISLCSI